MGRLTLNVLLSFAQFEREVTGERIRDKIAASKKKGLWMGGQPALGYDVKDRKLVVNEAEAETVRAIFRRYLDCQSASNFAGRIASRGMLLNKFSPMIGETSPNRFGVVNGVDAAERHVDGLRAVGLEHRVLEASIRDSTP
jgi:DNA invertase Pin-like site-specific DNA recombinase